MDGKIIKLMDINELEKKWDELDHGDMSASQALTVEFIKKHINDINWTRLSTNPNITTDIIYAFPNKINWVAMCGTGRGLSDEVIFNNRYKIPYNILLSNQQLNLRLLIFLSEVFRKSKAKITPVFWQSVSRYQEMDVEYIDAYKKFIDFRLLSRNPHLSMEIVDKYIYDLDFKVAWNTVKFTPEIIKKHIKYIASFFPDVQQKLAKVLSKANDENK